MSFKALKNLRLFSISGDIALSGMDEEAWSEALESYEFRSAAEDEAESSGWFHCFNAGTSPALIQNGNVLLCLKEHKKVIDMVIFNELCDAEYATRESKSDFDKEMIELIEHKARMKCLSDHFISKHIETYVWIDAVNKFVAVGAASSAVADKIISHLMAPLQKLGSVELLPLLPKNDISFEMKRWLINANTIPEHLRLGGDVTLKGLDETVFDGSIAMFKKHPIDSDERIDEYLEAFFVIQEMSLALNTVILTRFKLTNEFVFKSLAFEKRMKDEGAEETSEDQKIADDFHYFTSGARDVVICMCDYLGGRVDE
ncbi:recombination-associated protein RdgC [Vibrio breoganii]